MVSFHVLLKLLFHLNVCFFAYAKLHVRLQSTLVMCNLKYTSFFLAAWGFLNPFSKRKSSLSLWLRPVSEPASTISQHSQTTINNGIILNTTFLSFSSVTCCFNWLLKIYIFIWILNISSLKIMYLGFSSFVFFLVWEFQSVPPIFLMFYTLAPPKVIKYV